MPTALIADDEEAPRAQLLKAGALRIDEGHMVLSLRGRPEKLPVSRHFQGLFRRQ